MSAPYIGYSSSRPNDEIQPVTGGDFTKGGFLNTSEDADPAVFPPHTPVRFTSTSKAHLLALGTGNLADELRGFNAQLGGKGGDVCVVRVPEGTSTNPVTKLEQTWANLIGSAGAQTGFWALRAAMAETKMQPRLVSVGYTVQQPEGPTVANPIVAELAQHLEALKAVSVVNVASNNKIASIAARETMSSSRMMPLGVAGRVYETINGAATLVTRPLASRILGLFAATDNNLGHGKPFEPICSRPILGVADINRRIEFDLEDGSTEAQLMLAQDVAVVVRGETAVGGSIADGGLIFLGIESADTGELWNQIHQVRGQDYLDLKMLRATRPFLGPRLTVSSGEAWMNTLKFMLLDHLGEGDILGFRLEFPDDLNDVEQVRQGILSIETRTEQSPVFRRANNTIRRYRPGTEALIAAIKARAGTFSAVVQ